VGTIGRGIRLLGAVGVAAVAVGGAAGAGSTANAHADPDFCKSAVTTQPRHHPGSPSRIYRAPHGCVWLERFDPNEARTSPYRIMVRVHRVVRVLTPPMPTDLLDPAFAGFCGPSTFVVQWPYVIHSASQALAQTAGALTCDEPIIWVARVGQYGTHAFWQMFKGPPDSGS
jgi:hypothetical protein